MMPRHYSEEELADYAFARDPHAQRTDVAAHLAECPDCRERLAFIERIDGALRERVTWDISDDIRSETPPRDGESGGLQERARLIDEESAAARELLAPLLKSAVRFRTAEVERDPRAQTTAVVQLLYVTARDLTQREPAFALSLADAAVAIARRLASAGALRSTLHLARAYLERGRTLFIIGRYKDAERSLDRAEEVYEEDEQTNDWDRASVWLIRANIYVESDRVTEARALAERAARQFRLFGDIPLYLNARLLLASALFVEGAYGASATATEEIVDIARGRRDTVLLARALQNCAQSYVRLGEHEKALPLFLEAYAIWDEQGLESERIRTNWCLASLEVETGSLDLGIQRLDETYRAFAAIGAVNDASLARLELAEALLRVGRTERVPELLRDVVVTFASEGMMRNARLSLAYLHDAMAKQQLSADVVRHVRTYIEHLPFAPSQQFTPLR